jgi:CRISPR-associated protein Csm1
MSNKNVLDASNRVALAALLHDLGKFAERARIPEAAVKDAGGNKRSDINIQMYCPYFDGHATHIHAAYTGIGMDLLEKHLPEIVGADMSPFAPWKDKNADDSIINAASKHHRPETYLQWIIAAADRLASGFERESFDEYNSAPDDAAGRALNHYTTRQETLLARIRLTERTETSAWRYSLAPLSPQAIFPVQAKDIENNDKSSAQKQYLDLWNAFLQGLADIPRSYRSNLPLWLDHFESLWLTFTHSIPSATAGIGGRVRPDVSLYDHSKTTAALAVALWRYHLDLGHSAETVREQLRVQWDKARSSTPEAVKAWEEEKFLIVQGDFFGIQDFIFTQGAQTQKRAAKLLRGRSFYVSLLTELAALKVLDALDLPSISQVVNAAGKFLIVAHNTPGAIEKLQGVQAELDEWFLTHTWGQSGVGLASLPAAARDFRQEEGNAGPFRDLMKRLFDQLEATKLQRFNLCGESPAKAVLSGFLDRFEHGECKIDGRSPAAMELERDIWVSALAFDQIQVGKWLATENRLLVTRERITPLVEGQNLNQLDLPIFGYHLLFTRDEGRTGKFGSEAHSGNLLRAWDYDLPAAFDAPLWNGYARRNINAYVPRFGEINAWEAERYKGIEGFAEFDHDPKEIKTLNHLARDNWRLDEQGKWLGVEALMSLKGDVDNLGTIFQQGLKNQTFAKMAALSRQMNAFFAVYLPWLCQSEPAYRNTYTVFAGGDDFFLIGPWHSTIKLAQRMKDDFKCYVAANPDIHFSAGLSMTKPGLPIRQLAGLTEKSLDEAKMHNPDNMRAAPKNACTCFGQTVTWVKFDDLMQREEGLRRAAEDYALSTGYLYALLQYAEKSEKVKARPENAIWHSHFAYRTRRLAETRYKDVEDRSEREKYRRHLQENLAKEIKSEGIERHGEAYKIALFTYLYQERD